MGSIRAVGGKSGVGPIDRFIYLVSNALVNCLPILMGAVLFFSACFRHPKPPVKWHIRLFGGGLGFLLLFLGIRQLIVSKYPTTTGWDVLTRPARKPRI